MKILLALLIAMGTVCGPPSKIADFLREDFNERVIEYGIAANGAIIEVYASPGGETWTIVVSTVMQSCILASGEGWRQTGERL